MKLFVLNKFQCSVRYEPTTLVLPPPLLTLKAFSLKPSIFAKTYFNLNSFTCFVFHWDISNYYFKLVLKTILNLDDKFKFYGGFFLLLLLLCLDFFTLAWQKNLLGWYHFSLLLLQLHFYLQDWTRIFFWLIIIQFC